MSRKDQPKYWNVPINAESDPVSARVSKNHLSCLSFWREMNALTPSITYIRAEYSPASKPAGVRPHQD